MSWPLEWPQFGAKWRAGQAEGPFKILFVTPNTQEVSAAHPLAENTANLQISTLQLHYIARGILKIWMGENRDK